LTHVYYKAPGESPDGIGAVEARASRGVTDMPGRLMIFENLKEQALEDNL